MASKEEAKTGKKSGASAKKTAAERKPRVCKAKKTVKELPVEEPKAVETAEAAVKETPVVETAEAAVEETPVVETAEAAVKEAPVVETVEVAVEEAPVVETAEAAVEETPVVETVKAAVKETPVVETAEAALEEAPVVETAEAAVEETPVVETVEVAVEEARVVETAEAAVEEAPAEEAAPEEYNHTPRRSIAFIGSECYPFVKTGGLGDVMYALPKALVKQNCDVKVILPRYKCIPWEYQEKMIYRGSFEMDLCSDGRSFYVGIMEYVWDGVVYDFIDNEEFFTSGNPYTNLVDDIPKYCYFAKAALAALNYMDWIPDIIHCHDWQAALVPVYLRTQFASTKLTTAKTILTIHNLRFQGIYNIPTVRYWSGLPDYVFNKDVLKTGYQDANMMKGGLAYANVITTVSPTYAGEIQSAYYGEALDAHLRYHSGKLCGIINGIDYDIWNPDTDGRLYANYNRGNVLEQKKTGSAQRHSPPGHGRLYTGCGAWHRGPGI